LRLFGALLHKAQLIITYEIKYSTLATKSLNAIMFCTTLALYIKQFALNYNHLSGLLQTLPLRHKLSTLKPTIIDIKAEKSTNRTGLIVHIEDAA
jgi:hypothetical protein